MKRIIAALVVVAVLGVGLGWGAYQEYRDVRSRASAAEYHLRVAESELRAVSSGKDFGRVGRARGEFAASRQDFAYISARIDALGPLYGIAEVAPWVGSQARAARKLMRAGEYVSLAGEEACLGAEALFEAGKEGRGENNTELVVAAIPQVVPHLSAALEAIDRAQHEYEDLSGEGLHPLLAKALNELNTKVPEQRSLLKSGLDALRLMPEVLGMDGEKIYLVLIQDAAELRPTGGFLGNYGIVRFRDGKMVSVLFNDSYRIDWPYYYSGEASKPVEMFARYFPESTFWALRDSNIWPDFERSARQATSFAVVEGAAERIDGVIAVTDDIVQPMMKVVGSITVPEYEETVDQSNVLERIRFHQSGSPSAELVKKLGRQVTENRKFFTSLVLSAILGRLNNLDLASLVDLAVSLQDSVKTKGLQVYFPQPELQDLVVAYDLAGKIKPSTGDYLWVVDMNLSATKDNLYVRPSIKYSVSISSTGGAVSELELTYDFTEQEGERFVGSVNRPFYGNYVRVYVPPGSRLLEENGTEEPVETFGEGGKTVFGNFIKVYPGDLRRIKLRYWQPLKLWTAQGRATYELLVQKQAGNEIEDFESKVILPDEASLVEHTGFEADRGTLWYRGSLRSDTRFTAGFVLK